VVPQGNGAPARHKCWLSSTKNLEEVIVGCMTTALVIDEHRLMSRLILNFLKKKQKSESPAKKSEELD
jgi:hypothetical protein